MRPAQLGIFALARSKALLAHDYSLTRGEGSDLHKETAAPKAKAAKAAAKPSLAAEAQIPVAPLDRFAIAPENPRKVRSEDAMHELAASLASSGVITAVICYDEGGKLQITAGGTRLLAARHARLDGLPYDLRTKDEAITAGLVEQEGHHPLHAADQAEAYAAELVRFAERQEADALDRSETRTVAVLKVANSVGRTVRFVEQRLALAALHPPILKALRENKLGLDQASAWANAPAERQAEVWKEFGARALRLDTRGIRSALDKADLAENDRLVKFAGKDRYAQQGGMIRQDLFPIGVTGEIDLAAKPAEHYDREAVKRAAKDRLEAEANKYRAQGWGFVLTKAGSVVGAPSGYTVGKPCTTKDQKAKAGVSLSVGYDGKLVVQLHLRKQAEKKPAAAKTSAKDEAAAAQRAETERATTIATQIVGRSMLTSPSVAQALLINAMACDTFDELRGEGTELIELNLWNRDRDPQGLTTDDAWSREWAQYVVDLQPHRDDLVTFLLEKYTQAERDRLLAFLVAANLRLPYWVADGKHSSARELAGLANHCDITSPEAYATDATRETIASSFFRQLVGLEHPPSKKKPAAKAKKSRSSK
jgi:ParB/RepB/Spo0J family partition protein